MSKLDQFREEESELFNPDGEQYEGVQISHRQIELMRDTINELSAEIEELKERDLKLVNLSN